MTQPATDSFLDVPNLLERSIPRAQTATLWYLGGIFLLILLLSRYLASVVGNALVVEAFSALAMLLLIFTMGLLTWLAARSIQIEQAGLEALTELVQLRRWDHAAMLLEGLLSRPARSPVVRLQALVYLAVVLARYHRFADALAVYEYLLEHYTVDEPTSHGLRLGRAMAMLREDRLFDADRAISDLRRDPGANQSGGLALVEIYRDVKTGHPREAIELFEQRYEMMSKQLGHRLADALALAARAHDMLNREAQAAALYLDATLLTPSGELVRRYPELAPLVGKYPAATIPAEAA